MNEYGELLDGKFRTQGLNSIISTCCTSRWFGLGHRGDMDKEQLYGITGFITKEEAIIPVNEKEVVYSIPLDDGEHLHFRLRTAI